jgi:hypothetical protein
VTKEEHSQVVMLCALCCMAPAAGVLLYMGLTAMWHCVMVIYECIGLCYTIIAVMALIGFLIALLWCCFSNEASDYYWY